MRVKIAALMTSLLITGCSSGESAEIILLKEQACSALKNYNSVYTKSERQLNLSFLIQPLKELALKTNETKYVFYIQSLRDSFPNSPDDQSELYASVCVE